MHLAEVLFRKDNIKYKIDELKSFLHKLSNDNNFKDRSATYNKILARLFELMEKYQTHVILIESKNNEVEITVGDSKILVANAVKLRDTLDKKINVLTSLIESDDCSLDILSLIDQREKYIEEKILLQNSIDKSDRGITID